MSESSLWKTVKRNLEGPGVDLKRIENNVESGTPDVNYCINGKEGWIELKHVKEWPKGGTTPLKIKHFSPEQRNWINRRQKCGGRAFLLLQVENEYFLFWDIKGVGKDLTQLQLYQKAVHHSSFRFDKEDLILCLTLISFNIVKK